MEAGIAPVPGSLPAANIRHAPRHHQKETRHALVRALSTEKKDPVAANIEFAHRHFENTAFQFGMRFEKNLEGSPRITA